MIYRLPSTCKQTFGGTRIQNMKTQARRQIKKLGIKSFVCVQNPSCVCVCVSLFPLCLSLFPLFPSLSVSLSVSVSNTLSLSPSLFLFVSVSVSASFSLVICLLLFDIYSIYGALMRINEEDNISNIGRQTDTQKQTHRQTDRHTKKETMYTRDAVSSYMQIIITLAIE